MDIKVERPELQNYSDYRAFLRDYAEYRRILNPKWSFGQWSKKLGLNSVSGLTMVLGEQRHAGPSLAEKFIEYFQFNEEDKKYFLELIRIQKAAKGDQRLTVIMLEEKTQEERTDLSELPLFLHWGSYALREMVHLEDYQSSSEWIKSRLGHDLSVEEISKIFERLVDEKIIVKNKDGKIALTKEVIKPKGDFTKNDTLHYHKSILKLAENAFHFPREERAFFNTTLSFKKEKVKEAWELIREFQIKFSELMETSPGDEIYQFQMQFFPITRSKKE
jgi:uncharacterized protein (TIGR02147 family)